MNDVNEIIDRWPIINEWQQIPDWLPESRDPPDMFFAVVELVAQVLK